eukprot:TRINITY_DN44210_c0_g1_i2.p1 TRINITY_DN44210_c0_g1~~TRINITY_DN44210_c0_g1_i2.p1  ORF type:complete len:598 (-),score=129.07 TRINITY_DN44210_c0_g1_i2:41-1654(-)
MTDPSELYISKFLDWYAGVQIQQLGILDNVEDFRLQATKVSALFKQYFLQCLRGLTSWTLKDLEKLDRMFRTFNWVQNPVNGYDGDVNENTEMQVFSFEQVFSFVCNPVASRVGGLNRASDRTYAVETKQRLDEKERLQGLTVNELIEEMSKMDILPVDFDQTAHRSRSYYIDLILSKAFKTAVQVVHESGFTALISLMNGESITCSICFDPIEQPIITRCVHIFCKGCIDDYVRRAENPKCAICRKSIKPHELALIDMKSEKFDFTDDSAGDSVSSCGGKDLSRSEISLRSVRRSEATFCPPTPRHDVDLVKPQFDQELSIDHKYPMIDKTFLHCVRTLQGKYCAKLQVLLSDIQAHLEKNSDSKFVVFSMFPDLLHAISEALTSKNINSVRISGNVSGAERMRAIALFNQVSTVKVFLLTLGSGAAGLTLTKASTLYFAEPCLRIADELQALNRIHRIGQTNEVRVVTIYTQGTMEERLVFLKERSTMEPENSAPLEEAVASESRKKGKRKAPSAGFEAESFSLKRICLSFGFDS